MGLYQKTYIDWLTKTKLREFTKNIKFGNLSCGLAN